MNAITFEKASGELGATMDRVTREHAPVVIERGRSKPVVLVSLEDYESLEETAYLSGSPVNAGRLTEAIHQLNSGGGTERTLIE